MMKAILKKGNLGIVAIVLFSTCINPIQHYKYSEKEFLAGNHAFELESWKNWCIAQRSNYYIIRIGKDTIVANDKPQIIFGTDTFLQDFVRYTKGVTLLTWQTDSGINVKLTMPDTTHTIQDFNDLERDSLWLGFYAQTMNITDLKSHIDFIFKYGLQKVNYMENPDRLYFQSDSIDLLYLFTPVDSGYGLYKNKIKDNWYSPCCP